MRSFAKRLLVFIIIVGSVHMAFADKGVKRKMKSRTKINITAPVSLQNLMTLNLNLKSGLSYKGSLLSSTTETVGAAVVNTSMFTYQRGNTTYIIPYKHKIVIPDMAPGYTGLKLIIHSKK